MIDDSTGRRLISLVGLTQKTKPHVEIVLDDAQEGAFVPSYTTLDKIEGMVSITAPCDLRFGDIQFTFEGFCKVATEPNSPTPSARSKIERGYTFLRLPQPIDARTIPLNRTFAASQTYSFPFIFVVPERLLPQSCRHAYSSELVHNAHLALPPSLGDPLVASDGTNLLNDLASPNSLISYRLRVIITRCQHSTAKLPHLVDEIKKLRIIPSYGEQPPIEVLESNDNRYAWRKEKEFRKGIFKGKLGRVTIEAAQPKSLRLPPVRQRNSCPVTTLAVINLRFDPSDDDANPPPLGDLVSKLKVITFYSVAPIQEIPTLSTLFLDDSNHGKWDETILLSSRNVESAASWTRRGLTDFMDQDTVPRPSGPLNSRFFWSAQILVPVTLPTNNKTFVPTFHSCLISRSYFLDLSLSVQSPGSVIFDPTMHLRVPLQISSEGNADAQPLISQAEALAIATRESLHALLPRSIAPPSPEYTERMEVSPGGESHQMYPSRNALPPSPENTDSVELATAARLNSNTANPPEYSAVGSPR